MWTEEDLLALHGTNAATEQTSQAPLRRRRHARPAAPSDDGNGAGREQAEAQAVRAADETDPAQHREHSKAAATSAVVPAQSRVWHRSCCPHVGSLNGDFHVGLRGEDLLEGVRCFRAAFLDPVTGEWPWPTNLESAWCHVCGPQCPMFIHRGNLFFCCLSGNYHLCTAADCDKAEVQINARVCAITSNIYSIDQDKPHEDDWKRSSDWIRRVNNLNAKDIAVQVDNTTSEVTEAIGRFCRVQPDAVRFQSLIRKAVELFVNINRSAMANSIPKPRSFTTEIHTLIVLQTMAHGGERVNSVQVLDDDPTLKPMLWPLTRFASLRVKYNECQKFVRKCLTAPANSTQAVQPYQVNVNPVCLEQTQLRRA